MSSGASRCCGHEPRLDAPPGMMNFIGLSSRMPPASSSMRSRNGDAELDLVVARAARRGPTPRRCGCRWSGSTPSSAYFSPPMRDDVRDRRQRLDVVHDGRLRVEALHRGERRLDARHRRARPRGSRQQRGLVAAMYAPAPRCTTISRSKPEPWMSLPRKPLRVRVADRLLEPLVPERELAAQVDERDGAPRSRTPR